jgi:hypothetical protein
LLVPSGCTLRELHGVIQAAMGCPSQYAIKDYAVLVDRVETRGQRFLSAAEFHLHQRYHAAQTRLVIVAAITVCCSSTEGGWLDLDTNVDDFASAILKMTVKT